MRKNMIKCVLSFDLFHHFADASEVEARVLIFSNVFSVVDVADRWDASMEVENRRFRFRDQRPRHEQKIQIRALPKCNIGNEGA